MARKKGLLERLVAEWKRAEARRAREQREAEARSARTAKAVAGERARASEAARRRVATAEKAAERAALQARREGERRQREADRKRLAAEREQAEAGRQRARQEADEAQRLKRAETEKLRLARAAVQAAHAEEAQRRREVAGIQRRQKAELLEKVRTQNEAIEQRLRELSGVLLNRPREPLAWPWVLEEVFNREGQEVFVDRLQTALATSSHPAGVPGVIAVAYRPEVRELIIETEFPRAQVIPTDAEFRISRGGFRAVPRGASDTHKRYHHLLASLTLRLLDEIYRATPATLVESVVLSGRVTAVDRATGRTIQPLLISLQVERAAFEALQLDEPELDPVLCIKSQNALVSPHPGDLVPVKPVLYYDLQRYKTIAHAGLAIDLDSRLDLLTLSTNEFETLIRELFEKMGLRSWQTQSSRDDGVDAVAVNEDPVLGGLAIIQAKRYSKVVNYESITALAGVMQDKAAAKGILVTTSWVGKSSVEFAQRNGRIQIIQGRELKGMLADTLKMDVLISLPALPKGWERAELA